MTYAQRDLTDVINCYYGCSILPTWLNLSTPRKNLLPAKH